MGLLNAIGTAGEAFAQGLIDADRLQRQQSLLNATPEVAPPPPKPASDEAAKPPPAPANPAVDSLFKAIYGQESGSGANPATSSAGARGGMQIIPSTFAAYARPGESIDNPTDNLVVGRRIIEDLYNRANGDPGRVAVGYFSGPANIAPLAFKSPWREDRTDTNGKSTSGYVSDVLQRLARQQP